ncbi:MAG: hypothetical protein HYX50_02710 [Chloroflexi bacterium]|nr:hypothetical protein [Chloroflexota bacterium]
MHNEDLFAIFRDGVLVSSASKNAQAWSSTSEPSGSHQYSVVSHTNAYCLVYGGFCGTAGPISVNVQPPAANLKGSAYSILNGSLSPTEGAAAQRYRLTVQNVGTLAAGGSYAAIKFSGNLAPDGNGLCYIASVPAGGSASCDTVAITTSFAGGPITVVADVQGNVSETNEGDNTWSSGATLAVKPQTPTNVRVAPPYAAYGYTDQSAIETGFVVKVEWKSTCSGSTGWSTLSPGRSTTESALSGTGTDRVVIWGFPAGKCYRLRVQANAQFATSADVISQTYLCC